MTQALRSPETPAAGRPRLMHAAVIEAPGRLRIDEVALPVAGRGQVRVRMEGCGVCASNIPPWEGRPWFQYPMPPGNLGHEGWGRVDEVGEGVAGVAEGDRVAIMSSRAYAEYDVADADGVVKLPPELDGRPVPGEPLGCALNIFRRSGIRDGHWVAIVGVGFLGALLTQLCRAAGANVIAVSHRPFSLRIAADAGARHVVNGQDQWPAIEAVKQYTGGRMCDRAIEATGKQQPLDLAGELVRERGRLIIAGYHQDGLRQVNLQSWNWRGIDVINAHERNPQTYISGIRRALDVLRAGRMDPQPLFTHRYPLDRLDEALEVGRCRPEGFVKALVTCACSEPRP